MATAILNEPVVAGNTAQAVVHVEFHGFKIPTIMHDGKPHFAIKPICEAIGLDFSSQLRNIKRDAVLGTCVVKLTMQMPGDDQAREYTFLPVHFFNGWIFKVDANRYVKRTIREALITYQREGYDVMCAYFNRGIAVNPRVLEGSPTGPTPSALTTSSRRDIQNLIAAKVSHYSSELRPKAFAEAWSRVKNKFRVAKYEEIPEASYPDVVTYILAMEMKTALPEPEAPKALPAADQPRSIRDYAWFYPGLPETPDMWRRLSFKACDLFEQFGKDLDAIEKEAFRPFREKRRSGVATFLDEAMSPHYAMFKIADEHMRTAYRCIYESLDGTKNVWSLLRRG